jgi:H+/Cl- antiporter ClcA
MKLIYRPLSLLASVIGGLAASMVFKNLWKTIAGEDDAPTADQPDRSWKEVATAAVLQGAVTGGVGALVSRGSMRGFEKATGVWPGQSGSDE